MRHWTTEVDKEADKFFDTLSDKEIRRRQRLCTAQIETAYREKRTDALADLQAAEAALMRTMLKRVRR